MLEKPRLGDGAETEKGCRRPLWMQQHTKAIIALAATTVLIVIGLAIGLGVGLTRGRGGGDDEGSDGGIAPNRTSVWKPGVGEPWQIVLKKAVEADGSPKSAAAAVMPPDVKILDIDVFDNDANTVAALRAAGVKVVCYFSAGSREDWRDDKDRFADADLGKGLDGWKGERWVNVSSPGVRDIMKDRIKVAANKGCDAIDPDNVDGYQNDNGLNLTAQGAADFVRFLSREAASYNMSTGLKNAASIIDDVLDAVAFSVNEQCVQYGECATFAPFIKAGKPVFHIEYPKDATKAEGDICSRAGKAADSDGFSTVIKKMDLDGWVEYCGGSTFTTKTSS
ncbi:glycoside-hydrolase family protein [Hirsutella rhossiliensis]|uniref:alpha-galactosidase n=1 Tax=Hirsutella rhossiliensis TaxID=111463 RepID=A0A9P8N0N1_9HYPO|nr:glycoside-hydrolase family protein [Hirsutella rhossiliensis]KAH0965518.1 glycoside-hydrolase family protein [Hirsutella rhossiliensis]